MPSLALNYVALQLLLLTEVVLDAKTQDSERLEFDRNQGLHELSNQGAGLAMDRSTGVVPWLGGAGPIVWRQLKAILRLKAGLCWLLIPMALVLAAGAYLAYDIEQGAFQTVAVVVVMTSVFLPGLLPFDFRGDLGGLPALKMMPMKPLAVVIGQLTVPVILLTAFSVSVAGYHSAS